MALLAFCGVPYEASTSGRLPVLMIKGFNPWHGYFMILTEQFTLNDGQLTVFSGTLETGDIFVNLFFVLKDIEELVTTGRQLKGCPYYGSRQAVEDAQVTVQ